MKHQKTEIMKTYATSTNSYASKRTAEITVWIIGILVLALLLFSTNSKASTFQFEDEAYIDDIPFDTEMVVHLLMLPEFDFEEEAYIDDIPFNTAKISAEYYYEIAMAVDFEIDEEAFVNDIPFNTKAVAMIYNYNLAIEQNYNLPEELYVSDIPFNTCLIAAKATNGSNSDVYACTR